MSHKVSVRLPDEAYQLLLEAAGRVGMTVEVFARVCIFSVLANYAKEQEFDDGRQGTADEEASGAARDEGTAVKES